MTAAVAVMSATTAPTVPKRHGFSIESLIGTQETPAPSSPSLLSAPSKPTPVRPVLLRDATKEEKHRERERGDHGINREREIRVRESREKEIERDLEKEKVIALEEMRERELREMRDRERTRDREMREIRDRDMREIRDRDMREIRDNRDDRGSNPHFHRLSPHSTSPSSPRAEKSLTPESENRLTVWPDEEFKHLLANFHNNQLDSAGIYQPLRVCNRTLVSMGGVPGPTAPPNPLGVGMPPHFTHLPINPLLYNIPRDLAHQTHPLLTSRYPGFLHPRYPIGPPPGLLFHPYRKPKRNRTAFSPSQLLQLEQAFEKNHYVVGQERKSLAAKLQLTETQVKVWFQNRRTKHKRMKAEEDEGCPESQAEGQDGDGEKEGSGSNLISYADQNEEDEGCSEEEEEEEELSVTEDC